MKEKLREISLLIVRAEDSIQYELDEYNILKRKIDSCINKYGKDAMQHNVNDMYRRQAILIRKINPTQNYIKGLKEAYRIVSDNADMIQVENKSCINCVYCHSRCVDYPSGRVYNCKKKDWEEIPRHIVMKNYNECSHFKSSDIDKKEFAF